MPFNAAERAQLLLLKGVGSKVVQRLEEAGFSQLSELAPLEAETLTQMIGNMLGSRCWQNSPIARQSMQSIIELAKKQEY